MAYGFAIIGYGGMAGAHVKRIKADTPFFELKGAFDVREEAKQRAVNAGLVAYNTADELYADKEVDIVLVATPNNMHKRYAIEAMRAGKHVISEKPVTISTADLEEMITVSKQTGKLLTVHHNRRWDPDFIAVQKAFREGVLRDPYVIESRIQGNHRFFGGWRNFRYHGGGMLFDWGSHLIDQMLYLFPDKKVVSVNAHLNNRNAVEVDDNFIVMIRFEHGLTYMVSYSTNSFLRLPRWNIIAANGTLQIENFDTEVNIVRLKDGEAEPSLEQIVRYTEEGPVSVPVMREKRETETLVWPAVTQSHNSYEFYRNIRGVLDGTAELIVKPEEALRVLRVIEAAFRSQSEGAAVKCEI